MLLVVSPAKTLDYQSPLATSRFTQPILVEHSQALIEVCKGLTPADISQLMKVSDKIAGLNAARFADWVPEFTTENSRQAILAFKGDVYTGLDAQTLSEDDFDWAQKHFRMLSGLYGLLKPLDLMQPYRLEMGTKLENLRGANLYQFWGNIITDRLNEDLKAQGDGVLINLASNEYFKAVKPAHLQAKIITPVFKDCKKGQYKVVSFYAKKARGMMVRYAIDHQLQEAEELQNFDYDGYSLNHELSHADNWVFCRG